jgi:elongation factor P hydroxylase
MRISLLDRKTRVAAAVGMVAAGFVVNIGMQAYARQAAAREVDKDETYTRPKPTRPIQPEIPSANRYRDDKVFLEYADSLFRVETRDTVERQIVKGNVKFRQAGMWMFCDSAYYYPNLNSLDAFGNVRMEQGDTLFVYADKLYYEGNERMARLKNGPSCQKVRLVNKDVTLTTDSLDYSIAMELGWYEQWGIIDDKVNNLTSLYGEYSPGTKNAEFYHDVVLVNNKDGFTLLTDTLHYNTATHIARIESQTEIQGANDTILTTRGIYNTEAGNAELLSRSMIIHRDSNNNVTTLEGDSIIYDNATRISRAYMFHDPNRHPMPMVLTDTTHKTTLIGGFGIYNDSTREAMACEYPLLMEYSQSDTLFLRADTIRTYIITEMVAARHKWTLSGFPEFNGDITVKDDDGLLWISERFFKVIAPLVEAPVRWLAAAMPTTTPPPSPAPAVPQPLNPQLELKAGIAEERGDSLADAAMDEVIHGLPADTLATEPVDSVPVDSVPMVPKEFHVALAYYRGRFFKQDIQGVADSLVFVERDSMMYMFRKPIVWTGERQVTGNRIDVHFNDSTADWALLPESGMLSEHIDEDFYNQLAGKKLFATFEGQTLHTMEVSGNVETIFLPQEADSTYNRVVQAESSYLTIEMENGEMKRLKMWPEVSGTVTPIFLMKRQNQFLQQFRWWGSLRPVREWYGNRWHWADDLGEVPDELEMYFNAPSDFGEPKSFPAQRPAPAPVSVPVATMPFNPDELKDEAVEIEDTVKREDPDETPAEDFDETPAEDSDETPADSSDDLPAEE